MSTTLQSNLKWQDPFAMQGYADRVAQNIDAFNEKAAGCIRLVNARKPGQYDYKALIKNLGGIVARQDLTTAASQTPLNFTMENAIKVKLHRKVKPVDVSHAAVESVGLDVDAFSVAYGEQAAEDQRVDMLTVALSGAGAALKQNAGLNYYDGTAGTLNSDRLLAGLRLYGDNAHKLKLLVMHSKAYFDLTAYQIAPANNGDPIANAVMMGGSPATFGRPVLITDSAGLINGSQYFVLALVEGAVSLEITAAERFIRDTVSGGEQIVERFQGEYAYNLGLQGFKWDVTNGGANPSTAAVATGTNWDKVVTEDKNLAGVCIEVD